jgi:hypothetical protein
MHFNLQQMISQHNLEQIETPFTNRSIDNIVKNMPPDKAPRLDGFNGVFIKKCWDIIKEDIYLLCSQFFKGDVSVQAINNSFITLVPKVNSSTTLNNFRPISLLNCVVKIITKLLGDRIQKVILSLMHQNQYDFIMTRTIQDCLAWAFEYIYQCQHSKHEIIILKLDFTKAFDTIEHTTIIARMKQLGFNPDWIRSTSDFSPQPQH